ncbi:MAG: hypothetical protein HC915_16425 [Anaerolineae bacterium]|nr:hypothetical protein [Anaerolineae bacterium]
MRRFVWLMVWLTLAMVHPVLAQEGDGVASISAPTSDTPLFGLVEIRGTATHPSLFAGYELDWSNAQNPTVWIPIQTRITQQVQEGILGQWDSAGLGIPDGIYQIRLQVILTDGNVLESQVTNLRLQNTSPTPFPTIAPLVPPTLAEPAAPQAPAPEASPTSLIEQPPTATPRPAAPALAASAPPPATESGSTLFNFSAVQGAFCTGTFFSLGFFGLVVVYLLIRAQLSPYTRRVWWQLRSEIQSDGQDQ